MPSWSPQTPPTPHPPFFKGFLRYRFKRVRQSGSDQYWQNPLENRHIVKLKTGLQKAVLLIELHSKVFFVSGTVQGGYWLVCSWVQNAWLTTIEKKKKATGKKSRGRQREVERQTYPWQCFLFVESVLGFDGRLSGAVSEECTTWERHTNIVFFRIKHFKAFRSERNRKNKQSRLLKTDDDTFHQVTRRHFFYCRRQRGEKQTRPKMGKKKNKIFGWLARPFQPPYP